MGEIALIAAMSPNNGIGINNKIPWKCKEDMTHFKSTTMGSVVLMGRNTFDSLNKFPLIGRVNIVVSKKYENNDLVKVIDDSTTLIMTGSITGAIDLASELYSDKDIFVIGGESIYNQTINLANRLIVSYIHRDFICDTFFPKIDRDIWTVDDVDHKLSSEVPFTIVNYTK